MITEHFYLKSEDSKIPYQKVDYKDVVMVYNAGNYCNIYTLNGSTIKAFLSISDCYIKYFKSQDEFIRCSDDYVVNINHIIGASFPQRSHMELTLAGNNRAVMRVSHLYAKKILASNRRPAQYSSAPRTTSDSVKKDEIILEYSNPMVARKKIKEEFGERVTIAYIRSRLKILSSYV
jgi:hypothetical protein